MLVYILSDFTHFVNLPGVLCLTNYFSRSLPQFFCLLITAAFVSTKSAVKDDLFFQQVVQSLLHHHSPMQQGCKHSSISVQNEGTQSTLSCMALQVVPIPSSSKSVTKYLVTSVLQLHHNNRFANEEGNTSCTVPGYALTSAPKLPRQADGGKGSEHTGRRSAAHRRAKQADPRNRQESRLPTDLPKSQRMAEPSPSILFLPSGQVYNSDFKDFPELLFFFSPAFLQI